MRSDASGRHRLEGRWRPLASYLIAALLVATWWASLAPTAVFGPNSYVMVQGHSMEPMLHTGDLVIARRESQYHIGDLVVFHIYSGSVIHRIVSGSAEAGWQTKGDNNNWVDPWVLDNSGVAGKFQTEIPQFGTLLAWGRTHVLLVAAITTGIAMLFYIPLRRKKLAPTLAASIAVAHKEPRMGGRSGGEFAVLTLCSLGTVLALLFVGRLAFAHALWTFPGAAALGALVWTGGFTVHLLYKLFDGRGVDEPQKSRIALAGRLYSVQDFPRLNEAATPVDSAVALRSIAEKYRLPVLHRADPTKAGEAFLLITVQRGAFVWTPFAATAGRHAGAGDPDSAVSAGRVRAAHAAPDVTVTRQLVAEARPPVRTHRRPGSSWRATTKTSRPRPSHAG